MANRGPPPPPPGIGFPAPPGMVQGGPGPRPRQAPQPQQYPPPHQQAYPGGGPAYRQDTFINASTRIHDIRPEETESKDFCRQQLTSYEVYTILPSEEDDAKDSKDTKNKKNTKGLWASSNKDKDPKAPKKKERWAKVQINQESYPTDQIIKTIRKLNNGQSITEKKARLFPNQSSQVTNILDEKIMSEREPHLFEWVLVQLDRVESTNARTGKKGTASMTIYLKRAPLPSVDVVDFYHTRKERARVQRQANIIQQYQAQAMRQQQQQMGGGPAMGPHPNQGVYQQQQQQPKQQGGGQGGGPRPPPPNRQQPPVTIVQDHPPGTPAGRKEPPKGGKPAGVKIAGTKVKMSDSDSLSGESDASFSASESGSDDTYFSNSDNDTPNTSNTSRDGRSRKSNSRHRRQQLSRSRERGRNTRYAGREEDFVMVENPPRKPAAYAPDVPKFDGRSPTPAGSRVHGYDQQPVEIIARTHRPGPPDGGAGGFNSVAEAYALGVMAGTRGTAAGTRVQSPPMMSPVQVKYAVPQRMVSNLERAADEDMRNREEQRMLEAEAMIRRNIRRESEERVERAREIEERVERLGQDLARRERELEEKRELEERRVRELEERRVRELEERQVRELEERQARNEMRRDRENEREIELRLERERDIELRRERDIELRLEREREIELRRERERDIELRRERERDIELRREREREIEMRRESDRDHYEPLPRRHAQEEPSERYRATPMRSRSPQSPRDLSPRRASPRDRGEQYHPRRRMSGLDYDQGRRPGRVAPLPPLPLDEEGEYEYARNPRSPVNPFQPLDRERTRYQ